MPKKLGGMVAAYWRSRWPTARRIIAHIRPRGWVALVLGVVSTLLAIWRDEFSSKPQVVYLSDLLGYLPWYVWVIIGLATVLWVGFEAAHREITSLVKPSEIVQLDVMLDGPRFRHPDNREGPVWSLLATNRNAPPMLTCYARVVFSAGTLPDGTPALTLPLVGKHLKWFGDFFEIDIGGHGDIQRLDPLAQCDDNRANQVLLAGMTVRPGTYRVEIEIGSKVAVVPPTRIAISAVYNGAGDLQVDEVPSGISLNQSALSTPSKEDSLIGST